MVPRTRADMNGAVISEHRGKKKMMLVMGYGLWVNSDRRQTRDGEAKPRPSTHCFFQGPARKGTDGGEGSWSIIWVEDGNVEC